MAGATASKLGLSRRRPLTSERGFGAGDPARVLTRRVLPLAAGVVVAFGAARVWLEDDGILTSHQGVFLMSAFAIAALCVVSVWSAVRIRDVSLSRRRHDAISVYRHLARSMSDASVYVFNQDLQYIVAESPLLDSTDGLKPSEMEGRTIFDIIPPETLEVIEGPYRAALDGHSTLFEASFQGEYHWVHTMPLYEEGEVIGGLVVTQRITERKRLEADLLQAQKMEAVGQLAGGIAHDFNNLLTAIIGSAELLEREHPGNRHVTTIRTASNHAAALTSQLLSFSRRQLISRGRLDINSVIPDAISILDRTLDSNVELVADLSEERLVVDIDGGQLNQVLMNLVINARDAMPEGGRVVIGTSSVDLGAAWTLPSGALEPGRYARLSVTDTGPGIPDDDLERIFDPFFTTKPTGKGTGLGLATVYGIAAQSGGIVHVYSNPGEGTAFHVYLPLSLDDAVVDEERDDWSPADPESPLAVLLVEDDPIVRGVITQMLLDLNCTVDAVADADSAEAALREHDVLLTDYMLPRTNGRDLAARLEAVRPTLKTIFMSGYTGHTVINDAQIDSARFLQKPFGVAQLAEKLAVVHGSTG